MKKSIFFSAYFNSIFWFMPYQQKEKSVELGVLANGTRFFESNIYKGDAIKIGSLSAFLIRYLLALAFVLTLFPTITNNMRASYVIFASFLIATAFQKQIASTTLLKILWTFSGIFVLFMSLALLYMKYGVNFDTFNDFAKICVFCFPMTLSIHFIYKLYFDIKNKTWKGMYRLPQINILFVVNRDKNLSKKESSLIIIGVLFIVIALFFLLRLKLVIL